LDTVMADTRVQLEVEDWVRQTWTLQHFRVNFYRNQPSGEASSKVRA
jgi:hypothetical protein